MNGADASVQSVKVESETLMEMKTSDASMTARSVGVKEVIVILIRDAELFDKERSGVLRDVLLDNEVNEHD